MYFCNLRICDKEKIMRVQSISNPFLKIASGVYSSKISNNYLFKPVYDTVSFTAKDKKLLSAEEGKAAADKLRTSTSGYRASLNDKFNDKFVYSMTNAVIKDMNDRNQDATIIGGDTREATKKYAPVIRNLFLNNGINVHVPQLNHKNKNEISPVASPVLAVATREFEVPLGLLLTASHNPWEDGGYNFLTDEAAVADDTKTRPIADNLENITAKGITDKYNGKKGVSIPFDPYETYKKYIEENNLIDFENIRNGGIDIYYEDFGGTGKYYFPRLMKDHGIELKGMLSSKTEGPNPTEKNLKNLSEELKKSDNPLKIGLATDGDSDRFGVVDEKGNFISAPDVIMLCAYHLITNKGMNNGTIIKNHATSDKIDAMADYLNNNGYNIDVEQTPVGFKYLGGKMLELENTDKPAIVTGEESGGLTIRGHIPEKDGFVAISTILDLVATEKRPISEILSDLKEKSGSDFVTNCINMKFSTDIEKDNAVKSFYPYFNGEETEIAGMNIDYEKTYENDSKLREYKQGGDGMKIYFDNGSSLLIRKSGTEPVLRLYIDAADNESYDKLEKFAVDRTVNLGGSKK